MSRDGYTGPKLPKVLLNQVQNDPGFKRREQLVSRKDRRKTERQDKRSQRSQARVEHNVRARRLKPLHEQDEDGAEDSDIPAASPTQRRKPARDHAAPLKSILKNTKAPSVPHPEEDVTDSDGEPEASAPTVAHGVKRKLAEDDDEIAMLEKRLGIKGKKSKALESDGLAWLIDGSDDDSEDGIGGSSKRKRPDDAEWLRDKRMKATGGVPAGVHVRSANSTAASPTSESDPDNESESDASDQEGVSGDDSQETDDFEGFDSEDSVGSNRGGNGAEPNIKRARENPYVAPVSSSTTKYVPPSLREPATTDEESLQHLRRQLQGLLNRLSEANMLSILKSMEELYATRPRQHVTSAIIDLLVGLVTDSSTLNDTFLILHTGFATALYKSVGTDFGAHLIEKVVGNLDHHRGRKTSGKQTLNLLAFLSNLYTFQLLGSSLIFDYVRLLLQELSEDNTELLLRVIRTAGQQLRHDDPSSLKDIVLLLQRSVAAMGEEALSVRTKFMIETINDLKNNRMKAGAATSAMVAEHTTRMKKILSSLSNSRSVKASEPLRITLSDIRDSEKKGKWWLVGASYLDPNKHQQSAAARTTFTENEDAGYESETPGAVNLHRLARTQGMNTDVRRAIFTTTLSSSDYKEAHLRLLKLHLKPKQRLEIPRVLVHCVGIETAYNPFYALVARQFCAEHKLRKAFQFTLWDAFQAMESRSEDHDDDDEEEGMRMSKVLNIAKFYAFLVANQALDVRVLKKLHLASLSSQQSMFVEMFVSNVLILARKNRSHKTGREGLVKEIFARAAGVEGLPQGLLLFIEQNVSRGDLASGKLEQKAVQVGCELAVEALRQAATKMTVGGSEDEDEDESE